MFEVTGDAIALAPDAVQTDTAAFERAVSEGTPAALEPAVGLYRGSIGNIELILGPRVARHVPSLAQRG